MKTAAPLPGRRAPEISTGTRTPSLRRCRVSKCSQPRVRRRARCSPSSGGSSWPSRSLMEVPTSSSRAKPSMRHAASFTSITRRSPSTTQMPSVAADRIPRWSSRLSRSSAVRASTSRWTESREARRASSERFSSRKSVPRGLRTAATNRARYRSQLPASLNRWPTRFAVSMTPTKEVKASSPAAMHRQKAMKGRRIPGPIRSPLRAVAAAAPRNTAVRTYSAATLKGVSPFPSS